MTGNTTTTTTTPDESRYPESEKLSLVAEEYRAICDFLNDGAYQLGEFVTFEGHTAPMFTPIVKSVDHVVAEFFGIDLAKLEMERREMIARMQDGA